MFWTYYAICVIYCFYQLFTKYQERYNDGMIGLNPGLDAVMVVLLAWLLAPIEFGMTWISWYKKAEEARRRQNKFDIKIDEEDSVY
jgi:hypothetical protein